MTGCWYGDPPTTPWLAWQCRLDHCPVGKKTNKKQSFELGDIVRAEGSMFSSIIALPKWIQLQDRLHKDRSAW